MGEIAIGTTTLYRRFNEPRLICGLETVFETTRRGYPTVVVDGGSPKEFIELLRAFGATVLDEVPGGMGRGRRQVLGAAWKMAGKGGAVVWMEAEKTPLVRHLNIAAAPLFSGEADLVILARENLDSYPPEQQHAEKLANLIMNAVTRTTYDWYFGPMIMGSRALEIFLDYDGKYGDKYDSLYVPLLIAMAQGLRVASVTVPYEHPRLQLGEEAGNADYAVKRLNQLDLVRTLIQAATDLGLYTPTKTRPAGAEIAPSIR